MDEGSFFDALKNFLRIGIFIGGIGFGLALIQPRESDEFVVSLCSGLIGLAIVIGVIIVLRLMGARVEHTDEDEAQDQSKLTG